MNIEMEKMLKQMGVSYGEKANCLVKAKVLTCDYIVKKAIESKDPVIMYHTALRLEGITAENIEKLADAIINEKDLNIMLMYAKYINGAPKEKLIDEIIKSENINYITKLILELEDPFLYIEKIENVIIKTGQAEYIYKYAISVTERDSGFNYNMIERLTDAIIQTKSARYIYEFAKNIFGVSMEKLAKAIIETKDEEYIYKFRELPDVPNNFDNMIERIQLKEMGNEDKLKNLLDLIYYKRIDSIEYNADIYRRLFVDTEEEENEIVEEIEQKKKTLKPQNQGIEKI